MKPGARSKPSPTHDAWLLVFPVRPSTPPEEYDSPTCGASPPGTFGTGMSYDQANEPLLRSVFQVDEADKDVAL